MGTPRARRGAVLGVAAALVGLVLAGMAAAAHWRDGTGGDKDFGPSRATPAGAVEPTGRTDAPVPDTSGGAAAAVAGPARLEIPRLELSAPIDPVGVASDGQVEVPEDPDRVGWYRFSPAPGSAAGSSVVVGHVDDAEEGLGVLVALNDVREGDRATVRRADGSTVAYRVVSRRTVAKTELAGTDAFRRDGDPVLTLVTCAGPYEPERGGYRNNLVVTAVEVPR
ncbi:class F sortase [Streptomyces zhihengii]